MARDPYMQDKNIRDAAGLQLLGGPALGAGLGWAMSGWFGFSTTLGVFAGMGIGWLLASLILSQYGGRSTR